MELIYWISLVMLLYAFIGYPAIVAVMAAMTKRIDTGSTPFLPSVTIVVSVFNEERVIRQKIENFLQIEYPQELLKLFVISDASTDATGDIVEGLASDRIRLLRQPQRMGKTSALNRGVKEAAGDIIIFTDANSMLDRHAVTMLVRHFADPTIGVVSGKSVYLDPVSGTEEIGGIYRRYEDFLASRESIINSIVGADGAIYALRKALYEELPPQYINDFVHPVQVVAKGYRAIAEPEALCRETVEDRGNEINRQTRIMAQSWLIFCAEIGKVLEAGKWIYAWQLFSHKLMRWLALPMLSLMYLSSAYLVPDGKLYFISFAMLSLFFLFAFYGKTGERKAFQVAYLFIVIHYAALAGLYRYLSGTSYITWNPRNS